MEEITRLHRSDYPDVFALSQFAFQYTLTEDDLVKKAREADRHDIWGYQIDGKIAGKLHIIPLEVMINGQKYAMGGISSVATWPEYRRLGIAKKLLHHALVKMKEEGQVIAYLHPFLASFYRKYGWEFAFNRRQDTIPIAQFNQTWNTKGTIKREDADASLLNNIYTEHSKRYNGMLVRDDLWWQQRVLTDKNMHVVYAYNDEEIAEGYMIYRVVDRVLTVQEIAYKNVNALHLLYECIGNHDSMATHVKWTVPMNNLFPVITKDPTYEQNIQQYFMARIVLMKEFLQNYAYTMENTHFAIKVADEFFPENSGIYEVEVTDGKANQVQCVNEASSLVINISIQYVTAMFLGYIRPSQLYEAGLITGDVTAINQLEKAIPRKQTYFQDFF